MTILNQSHSSEHSLSEWLSYLESIHTTEIDLGLSRIGIVAERLGIKFDFAKVITVAGTNGKGTTCAFLENALLNEELDVAVYSSPHIEKFNERLRINKVDIADEPLINAFQQIENSRADVSLTYYEYTTLAAFLVLMHVKPDIIILEVGLGGRLDATNLIDADIAVITTVDLDHQAFLGDTREAIGYEKAGIMRSDRCAIVGDIDTPKSVLNHAKQINAELIVRDTDFNVSFEDSSNLMSWGWQYKQYNLTALNQPHIPQANIATALTVLAELNVLLTRENVNILIEQTKVAGRTEIFHIKQCDVMLDVGHNPQATRYLAEVLGQQKYNKVHAVFSMLADKDIRQSLLPMLPLIDEWYIGKLDVPRAELPENIIKNFPSKTVINCFDNVTQAYKIALEKSESVDLILVFGSFFTVSEIRRLLI